MGVVNGIILKHFNECVALILARDGEGFLLLAESSRIDGLQKRKEDGKACLEEMERLVAERRLQKEDSGGIIDQNTLAFLDTSGWR